MEKLVVRELEMKGNVEAFDQKKKQIIIGDIGGFNKELNKQIFVKTICTQFDKRG